MKNTQGNTVTSEMTDEDWFSLGKSDAWAGKPKISPEQNSQAASMYDLGYSEGEIQRSPTETRKALVVTNLQKAGDSDAYGSY